MVGTGWGRPPSSEPSPNTSTDSHWLGRETWPTCRLIRSFHIDCSKWESRRSLQRAVAEQLELPDEVMKMFGSQDEVDDFRGVAHGSRAELQRVVWEMHRHIQKMDRRFLVIFHNGSNEELDLASLFGFPLSGYSTNKVLWTFQGKFRLNPRVKVDIAMKNAGKTDVFIQATSEDWEQDPANLWSYLVHQEATEVVASCKNLVLCHHRTHTSV